MTTTLPEYEIRNMFVIQRGHRVLGTDYIKGDDTNPDEYPPVYRVSRTMTKVSITRLGDSTFVSAFDAFSCANCDEYPSIDYVDENTVTLKTDCPHADGFTTIVEIDVPSGLLVCDDSLHDAFGISLSDDDASYNSRLGQHQHILRQATAGVAYGPVQNTSPSLYEIEPGKYVVANQAYVDDDIPTEEYDRMFAAGEVNKNGGLPLSTGGNPVAWFCTDLWAYSMTDYQLFLDRGGKPIDEDDQYGTRSVVKVPPGRYRLTHHTGEADFDYDASGEIIFAHFERIDG